MAKRKPKRLPVYLTAPESVVFVDAAETAVATARTPGRKAAATRALMMAKAGLFLGLRVAELCALDVADVDVAGGTVRVNLGKGGKDRVVNIPARFAPDLAAWINGRTVGYLFPGPNGKRLSTRQVQRNVKTLNAASGLTKTVTPHKLRHTYATRLIQTGADIRTVQELLGHESIVTTQKYTHVAPEHRRDACDRL